MAIKYGVLRDTFTHDKSLNLSDGNTVPFTYFEAFYSNQNETIILFETFEEAKVYATQVVQNGRNQYGKSDFEFPIYELEGLEVESPQINLPFRVTAIRLVDQTNMDGQYYNNMDSEHYLSNIEVGLQSRKDKPIPSFAPRIEQIAYNSDNYQDIINSLVSIDQACFEESIAFDDYKFKSWLSENNATLLIVRDDNNIVSGYCIFLQEESSREIYILSIAVLSNLRGNNYGFHMLNKAVELAKNDSDIQYSIILECRPKTELYYKNMGFKVYKLPEPNFYEITGVGLPAINLKAEQLTFKNKTPKDQVDTIKYKTDTIDLMIEFIFSVKESTSWWYKSWPHSARKEKAFDAIYLELMVARNTSTPLKVEDVLRAILANALVIRGGAINNETNSSNKALGCLQAPKFLPLKQMITKAVTITMSELRTFSGLDQHKLNDSAYYYPYHNFYKQKENNITSQALINGEEKSHYGEYIKNHIEQLDDKLVQFGLVSTVYQQAKELLFNEISHADTDIEIQLSLKKFQDTLLDRGCFTERHKNKLEEFMSKIDKLDPASLSTTWPAP